MKDPIRLFTTKGSSELYTGGSSFRFGASISGSFLEDYTFNGPVYKYLKEGGYEDFFMYEVDTDYSNDIPKVLKDYV